LTLSALRFDNFCPPFVQFSVEPRTRADYQRVFDYLKAIADTPLVRFDRPLVARIRDKAAVTKGRKFANDVKARFSGLFGWGAERGDKHAQSAGLRGRPSKSPQSERTQP
jgi:hypothetical protein